MIKRHENRVCGYLKPKNDILFRGFMQVNEIGMSEAVNIIVKDYFQRIPEDEKHKYQKCSTRKNSY